MTLYEGHTESAAEVAQSEYILREGGKALDRPTRREVLERLRARPDRELSRSPAEVIRAERDAW
jgi:hypothetical protein